MKKARVDNGVRMHVVVPRQFKRALDAYARKTGINASEHIRRSIEAYLQSAAEKVRAER